MNVLRDAANYMDEHGERAIGEQNSTEALKKDFLAGSLSLEHFWEKIFARDQATRTRDAAKENVALLLDSEIAQKCIVEDRSYYFYQLGFSYFHWAQNVLLQESSDSSRAIELLSQAVGALEEQNFDEDFALYVRGTLAYMQKDMIKLSSCVAALQGESDAADVSNRNILLRMQERLLRGDDPHYSEDYNSLPLEK